MAYLLDILVILGYFGLILGIGLSQRSKSGSVEGFTLGDRQIPWWAVLASIIAAEISAATFLGAPGEGFENQNWTYVQLAIGTILARVFVAVVFIPIYYKHGVISIYEFLQTRFGPVTRKAASITFMVTRVLAMGTRLYVSAIIVVLAFEMFAGRPVQPMEKFWLFSVALVLISLLTALYTSIGGIRAVIWTDFIQVGVLVAAVGFSAVFLLGKIDGGWGAVAAQIKDPVFFDWGTPNGVVDFAYILTHEYTMWAAFIASTFVTMATHGIDQDTVQRMLTAKNRRQSAVATILSGVVDVPIVATFVFIGLLLSLYYQQHPTTALPEGDSREVFPYFILHVMPGGLRGLVVAGILATAMGSLSTALNALSTSFTRDFILPRLGADAGEAVKMRVLRWSTLFFALAIIVVGVVTAWYVTWHPETRIIPLVLGILGYTFGSILGIFLVALFTKTRGNDFGNVLAMVAGFLAVLVFSVSEVQSSCGIDKPFIIAFPWRITLGTLVTVGVALCFRTSGAKLAEGGC
ncbi:MAG: sodium:solute symporter [Akkermansiaceae bacterium]|nr:sodium:solute symporter [Akkermansiaceae bacterium]MCF7732553.1 sodium:solute symporter [Akkermansiaceae bacterium]